MAKEYLDKAGLTYFWAKVKAYVDSHSGGGSGADYITETGKSGNWHYTKYNSGKVEAWGYVTFSTLSFSASGSLYRSINNAFTIPSGIFTTAPTHAFAWVQGNNMVFIGATAGGVTTTGGNCQVWKSTSGSTSNTSVHFHLIYTP